MGKRDSSLMCFGRLQSLISLLFLCGGVTLFAQISPQQAISQMGRGTNLGNTLEPPTEGEWAPAAQEYFFDDFKAAGFSTVRIPVRWYTHASTSAPYTINEEWMKRVETIVDWALERDFFVIINAHHSEPIKEDYDGNTARWDSFWVQISSRFQDKSEKLFFEMMNEPKGFTQEQINDFNARTLGIIRKSNPTRIVLFGGHEWSGSNELITPNLIVPNDAYVMGYFHSYDPSSFGIDGIGTWGTVSDKYNMKALFDRVAAWSVDKGIPAFLGEFGATRVSSDLNSRYRFYASYIENCLRTNMPFTVWDDNDWFQVYVRQTRTWNDFKDIVMHYSQSSVTDFSAEILEDTMVLLNWKNQAQNFDSVSIQRKVISEAYKTISVLPSTHDTFTDTSAIFGEGYTYRVITHQSDTADSFGYPQYILATPWARRPFNGTPFELPGTVEAEEFDEGPEGLTYHDSTTGNEGETYRTNVDVDIEARTDGGYHIGWTDSSEWVEYTINVEKAMTFDVIAHVASMEDGGAFTLKFEKGPQRIFEVPNSESWQTTTEVSMSIRLPPGQQIMCLEIEKGPINIDKIEFKDPTSTAVKVISKEQLNVFPNPSHGNLILNNSDFRFRRIEVLAINGKKVYEENCKWTHTSTLHLNAFVEQGVYILNVYGENRVLSKKIVIQE